MMSSIKKSCPRADDGTIHRERLALAFMFGGIIAAVFSFHWDGAMEQFVTASVEEFWMILVITLLALCLSEWRSTKEPCAKKLLEDEGHDHIPEKEEQPSPGETEEQQNHEICVLTAQYMAAVDAGDLLLAERSLERLECLQASSGRVLLLKFCNSSYNDLVRGFVQAGQVEKARFWFTALAGTVQRASCKSSVGALRGETKKRWREIRAFQRETCELIRQSVREGHVEKAEGLLSILYDFAPTVRPNADCFTSVITSCARAGGVEAAEAWLAKMLAMDLRPDEASYAALVNAHARNGDAGQARAWLRRMREAFPGAQARQGYNFDLVLQACGQIGAGGAFKLRAEAPEFELGGRTGGVPPPHVA
mmetsp:Transcript_40061/g.113307  ORF Transcript_40061/g.113307 Transcript_40061/m.113307 type:complete len:365 (+) Transcript_40061:122-1216(+)